jgi:hypothetical protein
MIWALANVPMQSRCKLIGEQWNVVVPAHDPARRVDAFGTLYFAWQRAIHHVICPRNE